MRVVITGGPGSGKTTLIKELRARGYAVAGESAQMLIGILNDLLGDEARQASWRSKNQEWSQRQISKLSLIHQDAISELARTEEIGANQIVFFDRGLHDSLAYYEMLIESGKIEGPVPDELRQICGQVSYDWVFVLDPPSEDLFRPGPGRTTKSRKESAAMSKRLKQMYDSLTPGLQVRSGVVMLPAGSDRVGEIFQSITPGLQAQELPKLSTGGFFKNLLVSIDQLGNAVCGGNPDNTISARVGYFAFKTTDFTRYYWKAMERVINFTFWPVDGPNHCWQAFMADRDEAYNDSGSDFFRILLSIIIVGPCIGISVFLYALYPFWKLFGSRK